MDIMILSVIVLGGEWVYGLSLDFNNSTLSAFS